MPQLDNVSVMNINTGVTWVTGQQATAPNPAIVPYNVYVNASTANQPPVGFLNNPCTSSWCKGVIWRRDRLLCRRF